MFTLNNHGKKEKLLNNEDRRDLVFKLAKSCARKFENTEDQKKKEYFSRYCSKRFKSLIRNEFTPNKEEITDMQNVLDVYCI